MADREEASDGVVGMRTFKGFNQGGEPCPICATRDDRETILIGIVGTQEGYNIEAKQVHLSCYREALAQETEPLIMTDKCLILIQYNKELQS